MEDAAFVVQETRMKGSKGCDDKKMGSKKMKGKNPFASKSMKGGY